MLGKLKASYKAHLYGRLILALYNLLLFRTKKFDLAEIIQMSKQFLQVPKLNLMSKTSFQVQNLVLPTQWSS